MTDRFYKELQKASKTKPSFQVLINGEWVVCNDISILPYKNTTLGIYLDGADVFYKEQIQALNDKINKQEIIINELVKALKTINGGA